ncbi:MAG: hypothetical protein IAI50_19050 [Candidatus Eremiobacteraeota bacterium]|nr:hypothetical protein [Candidatus Eremiobacteraeota bacterium]
MDYVFRGHLIPHGDYLNDPWFWHVTGDFMTLDVVTSSDSQIPLPSIFGTPCERNWF